jgi:glyoxylase-like metal-dependent hydrolase (beta-lactamase superfamily II)
VPPRSIPLGPFELTPVIDGFFALDGGAMFGVVPKPLWEKVAPPDARNRIRMAMRPWLVRGGGRTVLIDAGCGDKLDRKAAEIYRLEREHNLEHALAGAEETPDAIDLVVASHLHFDHAGGFTMRAADGDAVPRFPNARHVIRRGEWDDALHPHERNRASYFAENYVPLAEAGLVDFVDEDGVVAPHISVRRTGGHTMHHQMVIIEAGGRTAVFVADLLPTAAHLPLPYIMGYDLYPMETLAFKRAFLREAVEREYLILFEHDPEIAAGYIRERDGKLSVDRVL